MERSLSQRWLGIMAFALLSTGTAQAGTVRYENARWFDGESFVAGNRTVANGHFVGSDVVPDRVVDLGGGYVIPPFGDAHTHEFDSQWTFEGQNAYQMRAGTFYAMTMTAPTYSVAQVRYRFGKPDTVDVATSLGALTGPDSHPSEIYEALALRIFSYEEQIARQAEIRASRRGLGNAYWIVEDEDSLNKAWRELLRAHPDVIKVYLRHSGEYGQQKPGNWAVGGVDPRLLPAIAERARTAGIRLAVATSDMDDLRAAIGVKADIITHLPCYQDTSEPGLYYYVKTDGNCLIGADDAKALAQAGSALTLIASELAKEQDPTVRRRLEANVATARAAGVKLVIGSNAYGSAVRAGLVPESRRGLFTPAELLRMATMTTPRVIFPGRPVGCLDQGCEASFLVLPSDPLADMASLDMIARYVKQGREWTPPGSAPGS